MLLLLAGCGSSSSSSDAGLDAAPAVDDVAAIPDQASVDVAAPEVDAATLLDVLPDESSGAVDIVVPRAQLVAMPTAVNVSGIPGVASAPILLTISNAGDGPSGPPDISLTGIDAASFTVIGNDCGALPPHGTCTIEISYRPLCERTHIATLVVTASPGGAATIDLTGTSVTEDSPLSVEPSPLDFGAVTIGHTSSARMLVAKRPLFCQGDPLQLTGVTLQSSEFLIVRDGCTHATLPVGGMCSVDIVFQPAMTGPRSAVFVVSGGAIGQAVVTVTGTGI